jgi:hypothetical protein
MSREPEKRKSQPRDDGSPPLPDSLDKSPGERVGREVKEAIEADALLERKGEVSR